MTDQEVRAALERAGHARDGDTPWQVISGDWDGCAQGEVNYRIRKPRATVDKGLATFLEHAHLDVPALARDLLAAREALRELLGFSEWVHDGYERDCLHSTLPGAPMYQMMVRAKAGIVAAHTALGDPR